MILDKEYYNRFPSILRDALNSNRVMFPKTLQHEYPELNVYRGVRYNSTKKVIASSDFLSKIELKQHNPMILASEDDIASYSCSCYMDIEKAHIYASLPSRGRAIAQGIIKHEFGPVVINTDTTHVDWYLFSGVDPSSEFKVVEVWEKNG